MPRKPRDLTPEEYRLWQEATRQINKLRPNEKDAPLLQQHDAPKSTLPEKPGKSAATVTPDTPRSHPEPHLPPLVSGAYAGVDAATTRRMKRGQLPIDRRIDLHGMTREVAFDALGAFIQDSYAAHHRMVLVITGKGIRRPHSAKDGQWEGRSGVIRDSLPAWLNHPSLRPCILGFDVAQPIHGGSGAFYILLKRKR